ncbi:MAG: L-seryl-tRNA(Sec) selenium transferase [Bacteroidales bacterium]|nr:L-seryl-tRNA(Sec) selenium transferase [Bacteroidales bacterium]
MSDHKEVFRNLPGVDRLLASPDLLPLLAVYGKELLTYAIRLALDGFRQQIISHAIPPDHNDIIKRITALVQLYGGRHLRKVCNATGVVIHTNLGRAPFSPHMLNDSFSVLQGYNNLEFNLETGLRGNRNDHASAILKYLTGAGDILVVNNNAAAVMMILRSFAKGREVIVSRGELIEIGGSFRIPEIMAASDCNMVEVGTTNKTRISDYRKAVNKHTALLFKTHKSNYVIRGFTEEVSLDELVVLGRELNIPVLFDLGSGLLKKIAHPAFEQEPDVREALASGADLVCFSGDKLLGGPQAGIIAGKKQLIDKLKKEPMLRALRVCKTTLVLLETACSYYLNEEELHFRNIIFKAFYRENSELFHSAETMKSVLSDNGIIARVIDSPGQCGGGTLPDATIDSYAVIIQYGKNNKERSDYAERMYRGLLEHETPVLGILRQGNILFNILTLDPDEIPVVSKVIAEVNEVVLREIATASA